MKEENGKKRREIWFQQSAYLDEDQDKTFRTFKILAKNVYVRCS